MGRHWDQMGQATFLRARLLQVYADQECARAEHSWTAVTRLEAQGVAIRKLLDELGAVAVLTLAEMSAEEAAAHLTEMAPVLSDAHSDIFMEDWCRRHSAHVVVQDGQVIVVAS